MSKVGLSTILFVFLIAGLGIGYQVGSQRDEGLRLPPSRSRTTVPEDFAPPGVAGEVRRVLLESDLLARTEALSRLLAQLGPDALPQVRQAYDSVLLDLGETELVLLGEWWARFNPVAAVSWTQNNWSARQSTAVIASVMRAWGRSDPLAAMQAAIAAPSGAARRRWTDNVLRGWDESVSDGALEWAESLGAGPERQYALFVVVRRRVLRDGPEAAIAWAEALPDDDETFKLNVFRRVAAVLAEIDPPSATAFAERHIEGPYAKGLPRRIGTRWAVREPEVAMRWLSTLPAGSNRDEGVMESYREWLIRGRAAALAWLPGVERDVWLDPAVSIYAMSVGRDDPAEGIRWAESIGDPKLRNPTLGAIVRRWLVFDEASANAWLAQSDLPEPYIAKIRAIPNATRRALEAKKAEAAK